MYTKLTDFMSRKSHFLGVRILLASDISFLMLRLWFVKLYCNAVGCFYMFSEGTQVQSLIAVNSGYFQSSIMPWSRKHCNLPAVFLQIAMFCRNLSSVVDKEFLLLDYDMWYQTEVCLLLDVKCPFI